MAVTLIRNADWAIAWESNAHGYRRNVDVAFDGDTVTHVGPAYRGAAHTVVDGRRTMVMPGLVNIHAHPGHEPAYRGIREEHGVREMYMTGLFERSQAYGAADADTRRASSAYAYCELLKSGVTSVVDIGPIWDGWPELAAKSGLRAFLAPGFASARWKLEGDYVLKYDWDEKAGERGLEAALAFIDRVGEHPSRRLSGVLAPMQIDTCTPQLLQAATEQARARKLPLTVHIAQGVNEVQEMERRHGMSPIQWAARIGILGPTTILGHAIFIDSHSWIRSGERDLPLLAESGCTVAHCPTPFARYGHLLESFGSYRRAGANLGIGTDTTPHNMLEEMRLASTLARIAARDIHSVALAEIFHAATAGGAAALGREDLGRLAPGMKADLVVVDLGQIDMQPVRDPLRSLVFHAAERAVREVYIDGVQVVREGRVLALDQADAAARLAEGQSRMMSRVPARDFRGRSADDITPLSLPRHD